MKWLYLFFIVTGTLSSIYLGYLYWSQNQYSVRSIGTYIFLIILVEFGCFAFKDREYEYYKKGRKL